MDYKNIRTDCIRLAQSTYTGIDYWAGRTLHDLAEWIRVANQEVKRNE